METPSRSINYRQAIGGTTAKVYHLHPCEKTLAWITALILIFQPWALGGMRLWSQYIVGGLALLAFAVALIPRNYTDEHHAGGSFHLRTWPKLLRFPIFWIGLIYFGVILIQIANPAWQYVSSEKGWWLQRIEYIKWLPHGVTDTPASMMNGWRTMLIQGAAWLLVCALWIGVTRRKTARIILTTIALNGVAIAIIILIQRMAGADKLLWLFKVGPSYFAASFIYKNHAGAYLIMGILLCLGLAWSHMIRAEQHFSKSHPGTLFVIFAIISAVALLLTYARAATILGAVGIALVIIAYSIRFISRKNDSQKKALTGITTLVGLGFIVFFAITFDTRNAWGKFERLGNEEKFRSITIRQIATTATLEMALASRLYGHGAGSFRFLFPKYQQGYPEIWRYRHWDKKKQKYRYGNRLFWEHSHNDYAEYLAENGILGVFFAGSIVILLIGAMWKGSTFQQPATLISLGGTWLVAIKAFVDFPMHNPAVLVTGVVIIALSLRSSALSRRVQQL